MSRRPISFPLVKGASSRQAHADLPAGTYEREMSKEGFFGPASFFYHKRPPTGWVRFEGPLRPHAFDLTKTASATASLWGAPLILHNRHVEMRYWQLAAPMPALLRNADGDQLLFVHAGEGALYCDFGHLLLNAGDYVVLPRGTMWRIDTMSMTILAIEATGSTYTLPDKGMLGHHAIFDPAMLATPELDEAFRSQQSDTQETQVLVKARGTVSTITYRYNPLDIVGWHGDLCVVKINVTDIRPIVSHRYHLPPSVHTTFLADRFVVCTFAPRPFETDPGAIKVPFFHNNDDYDEVIFYHAGDFFSRDNIHPGMMTYHPFGFTHGPHPKALARMLVQPKAATDEYAVMIDTRDPLEIGDAAGKVALPDYVYSWRTEQP